MSHFKRIKIVISYIILLFFVNFATPVLSYAETIKAFVGDDIITNYDIQKRITFLNKIQKAKFYDQASKPEVLQDMIDELLIEQFLQEQKVDVPKSKANQAFEDIARGNNQTPEQFTQALKQMNVSKAQMIDYLHYKIMKQQFVSNFISSKVKITQDMIRESRSKIARQLSQESSTISKVKVREIAVYKSVLEEDFDDRPLSLFKEEIQAALDSGEDFAAVAKRYSHSNAEDGGDLGWASVSDLSVLYRNIILNLNKGDISNPFMDDNILVFLKLEDIQKSRGIRESEVTDAQITDVLHVMKTQELFEKKLREIEKKVYIKINE